MRYALTILLFILGIFVVKADPIIITTAKDTTLLCNESNVQSLLTNWYNNHGGGKASNNGNPVTYTADLTLQETIATFLENKLCGNTYFTEVEFFANDTNNATVSLGKVRFIMEDKINPVITKLPEFVSFKCQEGIQDTFINWIKNNGGATATDNCSDIIWTRFIWNNSNGQSGTGSIDNGPYPPLSGGCSVNYNISFIAEDGCGNRKATTGRFTTIDDTKPIVTESIDTLFVSCKNIPDPEQITAYDYCDSKLQFDINEQTTQSEDVSQCGYYNYVLTRDYIISDVCGNATTFTKYIAVSDSIPPVIELEASVTVNCSVFEVKDTSFATASDNCSPVDFSFTDELSEALCEYIVRRTYTATDICGNTTTASQQIIVRDLTPPEFENLPQDTVVFCSDDIENAFSMWLNTMLSISTMDNCNSVRVTAAEVGSYNNTDTLTFPQTLPTYENVICDYTSPDSGEKQIDFIAYDNCGNVTVHSASFVVQDTIAPIIYNCIQDTTIYVDETSCGASFSYTINDFEENCGNVFTQIILDGKTLDTRQGNEVSIERITTGNHTIELKLFDCSGNTTSCSFNTNAVDTVAPEFVYCGTDESIALYEDSCSYLYELQKHIEIRDLCGLTKQYNERRPALPNQELITFSTENDTLANNKTITFEDVFPVRFNTADISLSITIFANLDESNYYSIFGENGVLIGDIKASNCEGVTEAFIITQDLFNEWVKDGSVDISFVITGNIFPCKTIESGNTDGISRIRGDLSFSEAELEFSITGATEIERRPYADSTKVRLNAGQSNFTYYVSDLSGNETTCTYKIKIKDAVTPEAKCKNAVVHILPSGEEDFTLTPALIDDGSNDKCSPVSLEILPKSISCDFLNAEVDATLTVKDANNKASTCNATIKVEPYELMPTFTAGVCEIDTLRLFANAPDTESSELYSYKWSGPNGFSSTQKNPFIPNATVANNGNYTVTVSGINNCTTTGNVSVSLSTIVTPELTSTADTVCLNDEIILNATTYTGIVIYQWYEGVHPNGVLLDTTQAPTFAITPKEGVNSYYVSVKTNLCSPKISQTLRITSIETPSAQVNDNFINVCEGETFSIGTNSFGPNYNYLWQGPNGFTSTRPLPETFENVELADGGLYSLVISRGNCISDTVTTRVNVFDKPITPIITSDEQYCKGSTVSLTVNNVPNGDVYTWFLNDILYTSERGNSLVIPNAQTNNGGEWQVIVKQGICNSDTSTTQNIIIDDLQEISVTNNGPACINDTIQLFATFISNATYEWTGPNEFTSSLQNPKILAAAGEYTVNIKTNSNCETQASTTVKINNPPTITALSNNSRSCMTKNEKISFFPTIVPNDPSFNYRWTGPHDFTSSDNVLELENTGNEINGIYTLEVINGACVSEPVKTIVNTETIPERPSITSENIPCLNNDVTLTSSIVGDSLSYIWTYPSGKSDTTKLSEISIPSFSSNDVGEYLLTLKNGNCLSEASDAYELILADVLTPPTFTTNSPICLDDTLVLAITQPKQGIEYVWQGPNGELGSGSELKFDNVDNKYAGAYKVLQKEKECISEYSQVQKVSIIDKIPTPQTDVSYSLCGKGEDTEICIYDEAYLPDATYSISYNANTIGSAKAKCISIDDFSTLEDTVTLSVIASINNCYSEPSQPIQCIIGDEKKPIANDDIFTTRENIPIKITLFVNDTLPKNFDFEITEEPSLGELDVEEKSVLFLPNSDVGTTSFLYKISNTACGLLCDEGSVKIIIGDDISCTEPTIITPNDDGVNDVLRFDCLENNSFPNNSLHIYNEWGGEVFSTESYDNTWNATNVPNGTYFYILDLGIDIKPIQNFLTIQR